MAGVSAGLVFVTGLRIVGIRIELIWARAEIRLSNRDRVRMAVGLRVGEGIAKRVVVRGPGLGTGLGVVSGLGLGVGFSIEPIRVPPNAVIRLRW